MRLLTLNTHSLAEEDYERKLIAFADAAAVLQPDIIALQEVSQTAAAEEMPKCQLTGYRPCSASAVIRRDNHVCRAALLLAERGVPFYWTWLPMKCGYGRFDEGIALMSRSPILETDVVCVSRRDDYDSWKTRKLLGIRTENAPDTWFYSVHFGWWNDAEEPFCEQWQRTQAHMEPRGQVWLMGDFNNPAAVRGEGYDLMERSGWHDSYVLAETRIGCDTAVSCIDGWSGTEGESSGMRIDQIWCRRKERVSASEVVFDGGRFPVVSDHCGVMIDCGDKVV